MPEQVFINGKIVTVDDYFSIQQAVAIAGERIIAVGDAVNIDTGGDIYADTDSPDLILRQIGYFFGEIEELFVITESGDKSLGNSG